MAEFHFLKGSFKGRLGDVVFSSWRGKDYAKTYTPPGNPNTAKQRAHRGMWGTLGHIAHDIYEGILKPYTFPKPQSHTAFNHFLMINGGMLHNNLYVSNLLKILDGALTGSPINAATWDATNKKITLTWNSAVAGNGKATDRAIVVAIQDQKVVGFILSTRNAGTASLETSIFQKIRNGATDIYLAFAQEPATGTSETGMNSITAYKSVTVSGLPLSEEFNPPASEPEPEKKT
jgi:hypothetical protein